MAGPDLVAASYQLLDPYRKLLGNNGQVSQANKGIRTNLAFFGAGGLTDGALAATEVACVVPIPVDAGDLLSKVTILVGATAAGTPTHSFAALYSGVASPALLAQSKDGGSAAIAKEAPFTFTLESTVEANSTNAPNGFLYAVIVVAASTVPTAAVAATPKAIGYQWYAGGPLFLSATAGSSLSTKAEATLGTQTSKAVAPLVFLS